ncbi:hypothetical protein PFJ87_04g01700 [Encephalitozoon hellem]|uniref:Uncharacterized protein n=1 Tax=Encephalitozoon hellem TaxID=27973 RepID=A0ABY8CHY3_ENCHE|nr:hypothetical protein PFJ87_04g01700 [Encephalitozoon hellem]
MFYFLVHKQMSQPYSGDFRRNSRRMLFDRLIEAIENLSDTVKEGGLGAVCKGSLDEDKWSDTKIKFMRKYGHIR